MGSNLSGEILYDYVACSNWIVPTNISLKSRIRKWPRWVDFFHWI